MQSKRHLTRSECTVYRDHGPIQVWRVQDQEGEGPYNGPRRLKHLGSLHNDDLHPGWGADGLYQVVDPRWLSGFLDPEDARSWFRGYWPELEANGFKLVECLADKVAISKSGLQIAFTPWKATAFKPREG